MVSMSACPVLSVEPTFNALGVVAVSSERKPRLDMMPASFEENVLPTCVLSSDQQRSTGLISVKLIA